MENSINKPPGIAIRLLARFIDIVIILAFSELLPKAGLYAGILYILIGDSIFHSGSIGKRLMRIFVIRMKDQKQCSPGDSIIRNSPLGMALLLTVIPVVGYLIAGLITAFEFLMMLGNKEGRRLGDILAGTMVVSIE